MTKDTTRRDWIATTFVGLSLLVAAPSPSWAADPFDEPAKTVNSAAATPAGQSRVASRMASELNASLGRNAYSAASLTAQQAQTGWGWGEVMIANRLAQAISQKTGVSLSTALDKVTTARQQGSGWGAIAKSYDLKVGPLVSEMNKSAKAVDRAAKASDKAQDKAAKAGEKAQAGVGGGKGGPDKGADKSSGDKGGDKGGGDKGGGDKGGGKGH